MAERQYDEKACKEAWKLLCSSFKGPDPSLSYGQAAKMAGITKCEMINSGFDNGLLFPDDEEEAKRNLAKISA
jgi:hypothetical protein